MMVGAPVVLGLILAQGNPFRYAIYVVPGLILYCCGFSNAEGAVYKRSQAPFLTGGKTLQSAEWPTRELSFWNR